MRARPCMHVLYGRRGEQACGSICVWVCMHGRVFVSVCMCMGEDHLYRMLSDGGGVVGVALIQVCCGLIRYQEH